MTTYVANLAALTLTPTEKSAVAAAVGYEDAQGMLVAVSNSLIQSIAQLQRIAAYVPSGSNQTAINNAIASLQT